MTSPCTGLLGTLACTQPAGHSFGHVFIAAWFPDRHDVERVEQ